MKASFGLRVMMAKSPRSRASDAHRITSTQGSLRLASRLHTAPNRTLQRLFYRAQIHYSPTHTSDSRGQSIEGRDGCTQGYAADWAYDRER